jgi:hypothetical protein
MPTESWQTTFREKVSVVVGILWGFVTDSCLACINSVLGKIGAGAGAGPPNRTHMTYRTYYNLACSAPAPNYFSLP